MSVRVPSSSCRNVCVWNDTKKFSKMGRAAGFSTPSPLIHPLPFPLLTARINPPKFDWNSWEHASCIAEGILVDSDCSLLSPFPTSVPIQAAVSVWVKCRERKREVLNDTIKYLVIKKPYYPSLLISMWLLSSPPSASSKGFAKLISAPVPAWDSEKKVWGGGRNSPICSFLS